MEITSFAALLILIVGVCRHAVPQAADSAEPIQIIVPVNHTFQLELQDLKRILEVDNIRDRNIVVVSVAGAFRQGKSFLMNFFIRYLNAQVTGKNTINSLRTKKKKFGFVILITHSTRNTTYPIGWVKMTKTTISAVSNGEMAKSPKQLASGCGPKCLHMTLIMARK